MFRVRFIILKSKMRERFINRIRNKFCEPQDLHIVANSYFHFFLRTISLLNNSNIPNMHFCACEMFYKKICHMNLSDNRPQILKLVKGEEDY